MMPGDKDALDGIKLADGTYARVWQFARPYRRMITLFLFAILAAALLALVPPFVVREIIDSSTPSRSWPELRSLQLLPTLALRSSSGGAVPVSVKVSSTTSDVHSSPKFKGCRSHSLLGPQPGQSHPD
jgi:ATP-binding cassette subfamily B protein